MTIFNFVDLCRAPDLYSNRFTPYLPNGAESLGLSIISWIQWILPFVKYALPLYLVTHWMSKKPLNEALVFLLKSFMFVTGLMIAAYFLKGFGRSYNSEYLAFHEKRQKSNKSLLLQGFDFDIGHDLPHYKLNNSIEIIYGPAKSFKLHVQLLSKMLVDSFGMFLTYPGASPMVKKAQNEISYQELKKKIEHFNVTPYVLEVDKNIRMRGLHYNNRKGIKSDKIIVYFSGNGESMELSSFPYLFSLTEYDFFVFNRPGFSSSSGMPWPKNEANSVKTVMEFVMNVLGYKEKDIIIYGWSIGGFSASIATYHHPKIHGLVIDGSFDSLLHFGKNMFPDKLTNIIECAIFKHLPIHTVPYLASPGKLPKNFVVVIRVLDQVMSQPSHITGEPSLETSRTVELALKMLVIAYKDYFTNQTSLNYARQVLSNYSNFKKVLSSKNRNMVDEFIARHIIMVPVVHEGLLPERSLEDIFKALKENERRSSGGFSL